MGGCVSPIDVRFYTHTHTHTHTHTLVEGHQEALGGCLIKPFVIFLVLKLCILLMAHLVPLLSGYCKILSNFTLYRNKNWLLKEGEKEVNKSYILHWFVDIQIPTLPNQSLILHI